MGDEPQLKQAEFEEIRALIAEFGDESDRAAVILSAAKLDTLLYQLLDKCLKPVASGRDSLLASDGPLSGFSARIDLCWRLGLIDAQLAKSLHLIRRIRNAFAHEIAGASLTTGAHRDRIRELVLPLKGNWSIEFLLGKFGGDNAGPDGEFRAVVSLIMMRLQGGLDYVELRGCASPVRLIPPPEAVDDGESSMEEAAS